MFPVPAVPPHTPPEPPPEPPGPPLAPPLGPDPPPKPPPADVISENVELLPLDPGVYVVGVATVAPPAPTVIGKDVAVTDKPLVSSKGLAV